MLVRKAFSSDKNRLVIKAINSIYPTDVIAHLLKYDTTNGVWDADISVQGQYLVLNGQRIPFLMERDPSILP